MLLLFCGKTNDVVKIMIFIGIGTRLVNYIESMHLCITNAPTNLSNFEKKSVCVRTSGWMAYIRLQAKAIKRGRHNCLLWCFGWKRQAWKMLLCSAVLKWNGNGISIEFGVTVKPKWALPYNLNWMNLRPLFGIGSRHKPRTNGEWKCILAKVFQD